jgi:magnesium chelatase subunit I
VPAITGKLELVFEGEREGPENVAAALIGEAVKRVFDRRFPDYYLDENDGVPEVYRGIASFFKRGGQVQVDDASTDEQARDRLMEVPGVRDLLDRHLDDLREDAEIFGAELILEGLHQHAVLAKEMSLDGTRFTDMVSQMFENFEDGRRRRSG